MAFKKYLQQMRWEGIKNTASEACPPFGVLAISADLEMRGDTYKRPVLKGAKPSTTFYRQYAINGPTAITAGGYGRCTRGPGGILAAYDSGTPANGEGWGPKPSQWTLSKGYPGWTVNGIHNSTKKRLVLNSCGALLNTLLCKTTGAITGGTASTSYQIWVGTLGSESNGGWTTVPSALSREDIDSGLFVKLTWHNNGWIMEPLECNA